MGLERADDAGVYKLTEEIAIIQTVDFFTPIVDDPYWFGQIAAANALSDVYAMGGIPKTAMNIIGFPISQMDISILQQILQGGIDKLQEAEVVLVGGHSVEDNELKYGLSVTGLIHPNDVITKHGLRSGDSIILTKPIGTGLINTAIKGNIAPPEVVEEVTQLMATLNRNAAQDMKEFPVHACTDITGFGLLGHLAEMLPSSGIGMKIQANKVPYIHEAMEYAKTGFVPAGSYKNRDFRKNMIDIKSSVPPFFEDVLFDPQTSGGLLICLDKENAEVLVGKIQKSGFSQAAIIGNVVPDLNKKIVVY